MKKSILIVSILIFCFQYSISQPTSKHLNSIGIKETIIGFLNWYKVEQPDTLKKSYSLLKGGPPDTTTKQRINMDGVEMYLRDFRETGYFSETYLNDLRLYFKEIDDGLQLAPKTKDLIAIPGMNHDWILKTFEPEMVLDHIQEGKFDKIEIIYNKAIARFRISEVVQLLFTLTRSGNKWLIDYIGYDGTSKYSISKE